MMGRAGGGTLDHGAAEVDNLLGLHAVPDAVAGQHEELVRRLKTV